ncbi:hypothetical protein DSECCO2_148970 [anaerobic digester metagenome]|nr:hypothetical protein NQU17_09545 [Clostridiaceae bacterium HFYG-1003]
MKAKKLTNRPAANLAGQTTARKIVKDTPPVIYEEREYYPVMVELAHLLEKTHAIYHEDEIIQRIRLLEEEQPEGKGSNGLLWQSIGDEVNLLLDERAFSTFEEILKDYLDPALLQNLSKFLEQTNEKRRSAFESASEEEKQQYKKIHVVSLN